MKRADKRRVSSLHNLKVTDEQMRLFMDLFRGNDRFHGESLRKPGQPEGIKIDVDAATVQAPLTPELYRRHLEDPDFYLGICPRFDDDDCQVGCIDLDVLKTNKDGTKAGFTPEQISEVIHHIAGFGWKLLIERSKSGGAHVWWFLPRPLPANDIREKLQSLLIHLCLPSKTEVFPGNKSIGNGGPWVHLPKPGSFLFFDGSPMSFERALATAQWFRDNYSVPTADDEDDKPEIADLIKETAGRIGPYGGRNKAGFILACRLRDSLYSREEAREALAPWLDAALAVIPNDSGDPYNLDEVRASFNSAYKHDPRPRKPKIEWPMARPLSRLPQEASLTPDIIPEALRAVVYDVAERQGSLPEAVYAANLVMLAGALNDRINVQPASLDTEWVVPLNLYGMAVGDPSTKKSPVISAAGKPLVRVQTKLSKEHDAELKRYEAACRQLKKSEAPPDKPAQLKVIVHDATPEKAAMLLKDNPSGLTMVLDEMDLLFDQMQRPERKALRSLLKSGSSGESFSQDRVSRRPLFIPRAVFSVIGGVQPEVLKKNAEDLASDGLIMRFTVSVFLDPLRMPEEEVDRPPNVDAAERLQRLFDRFLAISLQARVMKFEPDAQELYKLWSRDLRKRLNNDPSLWMQQLLGKYNGFVPRLAALFELCDWADGEPSSGHMSLRSLITAIKAAAFFESHARRIYGEANAVAPETQSLADKIRTGAVEAPFTAREVRRKGFKGLKEGHAVERAMAALARFKWIRKKTGDDTKAERWEVNPDVLDADFKQYGESGAAPWDLSWLDSWKSSVEGIDLKPLAWEEAFKPQQMVHDDIDKLTVVPQQEEISLQEEIPA